MVDWYVNAPQGLSYGAGAPRDISDMLMKGIPQIQEGYYRNLARQPILDPATGKPINPMDEGALGTTLQEVMRRGVMPPYLQSLLPYMGLPELQKVMRGVGPPPAEATPDETPAGPAAAVKPAPGTAATTVASLAAGYAREGIIPSGSVASAIAAGMKAAGVDRDKPLVGPDGKPDRDAIEKVSTAMLAARRGASAAPTATPAGPAEGETSPAAATAADARDAAGASGSPGVMPSRQPAETTTPALASAGIAPTAAPTAGPGGPGRAPNNPAGVGPQHIIAGQRPPLNLTPDVARAYAQAGPTAAAGPAAGLTPPTLPPLRELNPQQAMRKSQEIDNYMQKLWAMTPRMKLFGGEGAATAMTEAYKAWAERSKAYRDWSLGQQKHTDEEQQAERVGMTLPQFLQHKEDLKKDSDTFAAQAEKVRADAVNAFGGKHGVDLGNAMVNSPGFHSGVLPHFTNLMKQWAVALGADPTTATTGEGFQKVVSQMLTEQIKSMGQAGVGRVLMTEVQNMSKGIAGLGITPATNLLLFEILKRGYDRQIELADRLGSINAPPGQKMNALHAVIKEINDRPLFSDAEKRDLRLIAPPTVSSETDARAWGLKKGAPMRWGGNDYTVPDPRGGPLRITVHKGDIVAAP